jgi:hypothetical protein
MLRKGNKQFEYYGELRNIAMLTIGTYLDNLDGNLCLVQAANLLQMILEFIMLSPSALLVREQENR